MNVHIAAKSCWIRPVRFVTGAALLVALGSPSWALPYHVTIDTAPGIGTSVQLAFDFIDGGPPSNTVRISDFLTDGSLGTFSTSGGVMGSLPGPVTLSDTDFFNEYLQNMTLGMDVSFKLDATANAPNEGSLPDSFSFFLLNPTSGLPLYPTTDPIGADALFSFDIDGSAAGSLHVFSTSVSITAVSEAVVPEPSTWLLLSSGFGGLMLLRRASLQSRDK